MPSVREHLGCLSYPPEAFTGLNDTVETNAVHNTLTQLKEPLGNLQGLLSQLALIIGIRGKVDDADMQMLKLRLDSPRPNFEAKFKFTFSHLQEDFEDVTNSYIAKERLARFTCDLAQWFYIGCFLLYKNAVHFGQTQLTVECKSVNDVVMAWRSAVKNLWKNSRTLDYEGPHEDRAEREEEGVVFCQSVLAH
ncbi:hypothetical protein JX265_005505 [Neoarthrinium moseri]|uniref:Uncharacterized protein n=1 Tax=Neoarthrinium moseri TaxID=1658444 RepID=A0A9P9WNQ0_9PEZI|nr:hypothetical protein JX266_006660 [Neoarthrinium moseri]KAI1872625.1 hypothetical protein JX265_005505 [Neoarthrinium moseri]